MPQNRTLRSLEAHGINLHGMFVRAADATRMTRPAIAQKLGVSESILSRYYTGEYSPSLETLCDVAALAGLTVSIAMQEPGNP